MWNTTVFTKINVKLPLFVGNDCVTLLKIMPNISSFDSNQSKQIKHK